MGNQSITTVKISTELGDVVCHKMAFGDYAQLLRALDKIPKLVSNFIFEKEGKTEFKSEEVLAVLPSIAAEALPELAAVIASATDKDAEFICKLDLADVIEVTDGILQVNDFNRIVEAVKKLMARRQKVKPAGQAKQTST